MGPASTMEQVVLQMWPHEITPGGGGGDDGLWHDAAYFTGDDGLWHDAAYFTGDDGLWHDDIYF